VLDARPTWECGAGRGARIFRQKGALQDLDQLMGEFLDLRRPKKLKKRKKQDSAFLKSWNKEVPYRIRLECKDRVVHFRLGPLGGKPVLQLQKEFSRRDLADAWHVKGKERAKPFRIISLVRCHLREVVLQGGRR